MSQWGSPTELARQLCLANHTRTNVIETVGRQVPCGHHVAEANRFYGLTGDNGAASLAVLNEWAAHRATGKAVEVTIEEKLAHPGNVAAMARAAERDRALGIRQSTADDG